MSLDSIKAELQNYQQVSTLQHDLSSSKRFLELLSKGESAFDRSHFEPGHFTSSVFLLSHRGDKIMLLFHRKLQKWLQPGGHFDQVTSPKLSALRELKEECGVIPSQIHELQLIDLDIHEIPPIKNEAAHLHFDFRYLARALEPIEAQKNHESEDIQWIEIDQIKKFSQEESILRVLRKSVAL